MADSTAAFPQQVSYHEEQAPQAVDLPRYHLHPLKGARKGCWAVTVRANWRMVFRFADGDVWDVDLVDYH